MDALDCFADYSAGLHSRRSRLGSCRMRSSTVGYSRFAAYSGFRVRVSVGSVQLTFYIFLVLFTVMLIAEVGIMLREIKKDPN